jgi:hypothetical protein
MIPFFKIQPGQRWAFAKVNRGDIEISHVNRETKVIFWTYVDYDSNIFESPYDKFVVDFTPRDESLLQPKQIAPKPGPNDDRDFLT